MKHIEELACYHGFSWKDLKANRQGKLSGSQKIKAFLLTVFLSVVLYFWIQFLIIDRNFYSIPLLVWILTIVLIVLDVVYIFDFTINGVQTITGPIKSVQGLSTIRYYIHNIRLFAVFKEFHILDMPKQILRILEGKFEKISFPTNDLRYHPLSCIKKEQVYTIYYTKFTKNILSIEPYPHENIDGHEDDRITNIPSIIKGAARGKLIYFFAVVLIIILAIVLPIMQMLFSVYM